MTVQGADEGRQPGAGRRSLSRVRDAGCAAARDDARARVQRLERIVTSAAAAPGGRRGARLGSAGGPGMRAWQCAASRVAQRQEVEQGRIAELRGTDVAERARDGPDAAGGLALPLRHHLLHLLALQVFLRTAE